MSQAALRVPTLPTQDDLPCDRGPDFFAVLGVSPHERKSWVVWDEDKGPDLIIELLSESTARIDKPEKKRIYQDHLRVAEYFWFAPWNPTDFAGFQLLHARYEPIVPRAPGRIQSPLLGLDLVWWDGSYGDVETSWIRWADADGVLLPTEAEAGPAAARLAAESARADADQARADARAALAARDAQARRAAAAEQRARDAEAELARLRAQAAGTA